MSATFSFLSLLVSTHQTLGLQNQSIVPRPSNQWADLKNKRQNGPFQERFLQGTTGLYCCWTLILSGQGEGRVPRFLGFLCASVCSSPRSTPARWVWSLPGINEGRQWGLQSLTGFLSWDITGRDWNPALSTFQGLNWMYFSSFHIVKILSQIYPTGYP